jgi:hypothetical protein
MVAPLAERAYGGESPMWQGGIRGRESAKLFKSVGSLRAVKVSGRGWP